MYRCLAGAAGRLAVSFQRVQAELEQLSVTHKIVSPGAPGASQNLSAQSVKRVCDWLLATGLYSWLPLRKVQRASTKEKNIHLSSGADWLSQVWSPPASEAAYNSLTYSVGGTSSLLSDMEKVIVNTVAARLGLPPRFHWPLPLASTTKANVASSTSTAPSSRQLDGSAARLSSAPANTSMLWPTAMRTTDGTIAARPATSAAAEAVASLQLALPALPSVATASEVFAAAPRTPISPPTIQSAKVNSPARITSSTPSSTSSSSAVQASANTALAALSCGGGVLFQTRLEAYMVLLHTARTQALTRCSGQHNAFAGQEDVARQLGRLVLYASDQADPLLLRAARLIGIPHIRVLQTVAGDRQLHAPSAAADDGTSGSSPKRTASQKKEERIVHHYNYTLNVAQLQARVVEDVTAGLYPVMIVGTFGSALSGAVDPVAALADFCHKLGVWYHLDASHGGPALLAKRRVTPTHASKTPSSSPSRSSSSEGFSASQQLRAFLTEFDAAALLADSVVVPAGPSALPYAALRSSATQCRNACGAAVLFVSHVRKVAWAVQTIGEGRQSTYNAHLRPSVSDSDVLRVSPLSHSCGWLTQQTLAQQPSIGQDEKGGKAHHALSPALSSVSSSSPVDDLLACDVVRHQQFMAALQHAIRGDGRFDAALDATVAGMVHVRWLTASDEATAQLAAEWAEALTSDLQRSLLADVLSATEEEEKNVAASHSSSDAAVEEGKEGKAVSCDATVSASAVTGEPPVKVYVGLVQLQRRLWVTVTLDQLLPREINEHDEGERKVASSGSGDAAHMECPPSLQPTLRYVLGTLNAAALRIKPESAR